MDVSIPFLVLILLFVFSANLNAYLLFKLRRAIKAPTPTLEAQKLLHDIAGGSALLRITVIDQGDLMIRSPRG